MTQKIELPGVLATEPEKTHISITIINDGLKQAEVNLTELETSIKKLTDQIGQLQAQRIAMTAQRNLLLELQTKITEIEKSSK